MHNKDKILTGHVRALPLTWVCKLTGSHKHGASAFIVGYYIWYLAGFEKGNFTFFTLKVHHRKIFHITPIILNRGLKVLSEAGLIEIKYSAGKPTQVQIVDNWNDPELIEKLKIKELEIAKEEESVAEKIERTKKGNKNKRK